MRATGVVRRIDDLGRIVIPKEIRRTMRMKEGAPLEVFVDKEAIILKRYSPINTLEDHSQEYTESLQENLHCIALVCDDSTIIAMSGASKSNYLNKDIGEEVIKAMNEMKTVIQIQKGKYNIVNGKEDEFSSFVIAPIRSENLSIGAVILLSNKDKQNFGETEAKIAELAANFLKRRIDNKK